MKKGLLIFVLGGLICKGQTNLVWANKIGWIGHESALCITTDNSGNVFIGGFFEGTVDFDPSASIANLTSNGNEDLFIAKYDANGNYIWAKNIGGSNTEFCTSIKIDATGNIYITGVVGGVADFDPSAGVATIGGSPGIGDGFLAKYDAAGNYLWAQSIGGADTDGGVALVIDPSGFIILSGYFSKTVDFDPTAGIDTLTSIGYRDIFIAKFDLAGNYIWAESLGTQISDHVRDLTLDASGSVYLTGNAPGLFIAKYTSAGTQAFYYAFSGGYNSSGNCIKADAGGNVYLGGSVSGAVDFDPSLNSAIVTTTNGQYTDAFIAKYDTSGNLTWVKTMGGSKTDLVCSMALQSGEIVLSGSFTDTTDLDPSVGSATFSSNGSADIFIAKYDLSGNYLSGFSIGGSGLDASMGIVADAFNNILTTGYFENTVDFDPTINVNILSSSGMNDVFISKYFMITVSINEISKATSNLKIYPNPSTGELYLQAFLPESDNLDIRIYDVNGKIVYQESFTEPQGELNKKILLKECQGVYFVNVLGNKNNFSQMLIKQ